MKSRTIYTILVALLLASMVLAACKSTATPEPGGEVTATEEAAFEPVSFSAPDCNYGGLFKTIESVDELTVRFTMCAPDPAFPSKIAFTSFAIQPREHLEATGGGGPELLEHPIGTGPYMVSEWKRGDELVLTANPNYWGEAPKEQTLVFRWSTEAAQRLLELQSGSVDGIDNVGPDDFEVVQNDPNLQLMVRPALNVFYVGLTNTIAPFDNEKVRQALAMGIDRQRIVDNFMPAGSEVASHFTPCAIPNGCTGDPWYDYDPAAAKALLAEAGYPDGFKTTLYYRDVVRGYLPQPAVVAQDIQAQLKENLNVEVEIVVMESGAFIAAADGGELGMYMLGWGADYPDMTNFLDYHFGAGATPRFGTLWDDITEPLKQGASLADDAAREPFYVQANNAIRQHVPMIPISHAGSAVAYRSVVEGGHVSPLGNEYFAVMSVPDKDTFVWMQNAEPISLYCADESDGESLRACEQVTEALLSYQIGGTAVEPGLATSCDPNEDLTVWTCHLRENVKFSDGSALDANDVVYTFLVQWDAANPLHVGNTGDFSYFSGLWMGFLNPPAPAP